MSTIVQNTVVPAEEDIDTLIALLLRVKESLKKSGQTIDLNVWLDEEGIEAKIEEIMTTDWNTFADFSRVLEEVQKVKLRLQADKTFNVVGCLFKNMQGIQKKISKNHDDLQQRSLTRLREIGLRKLPDEIVARIFWLANEPLRMSHISQKFRAVAIAFPYLWSIPPFSPNKMTELYLSRSQNCPLSIEVPYFEPTLWNLTNFSKGAMAAFFTSLLPHIARCRTLTIQNLASSLSQDFLARLKGILMESSKNSSMCMFPGLHSAFIQVEMMELLDTINPELAELEIQNLYLEEDVTFQHLKIGLRRFRHLRKLFLRGFASEGFVWPDPVSATTVDLPSLKSLTLERTQLASNGIYAHQDLSRILGFLNLPALTDLRLLVKFTSWKSLQPSNILWASLSSYRSLTHLTLDADVFNNQVGPFAIISTVLAKCQSLVQFKLALIFCRGLDWLYIDDISNLSQSQKAPSFSTPTNQTWNLRCPLRTLYLRDCYDHQEDLKVIAGILVLSDNWSSFERLVLDTTTYKYAARTAGKLRMELENFLWGLHKKMEGKVEWSLDPM